MFKALLASVLFGCAVAQICPQPAVKKDFDINKFAKIWYEVEYIANEIKGKCVAVTYTIKSDGYDVLLTQVPTAANQYSSLKGVGTQLQKDKAKLVITVPSRGTTSQYWVLDTDYTSYAAMWRCENGVESLWVLTRDRNAPAAVVAKAHAAFDNKQIIRTALKTIDQSNCS